MHAVATTGEEAITTDNGTEVAVIISLADYERLHEHADVVDSLQLGELRANPYRAVPLAEMLDELSVDAGGERMKVSFHPDVLKQLQRLPRAELETALQVIIGLSHVPRAFAKKLVGSQSDWRVRFGQYRVVYTIDDKADAVTAFNVAKRSDSYR